MSLRNLNDIKIIHIKIITYVYVLNLLYHYNNINYYNIMMKSLEIILVVFTILIMYFMWYIVSKTEKGSSLDTQIK